MENKSSVSILLPVELDQFWQQIRLIIREEMKTLQTNHAQEPVYETSGLTYKPLYKMAEVCAMFKVTRPTIYDWIRHGKLKPYKIRSRVYFLWNNIQQLLGAETAE